MESVIIHAPKSFSYSSYRDLVVRLSDTGNTTGYEQTAERIEATKLNAHRMKRIEKQARIREELVRQVKHIEQKWNWTIVAEAWCGDGAQNIPLIAAMASFSPNIDLKIILRDENPAIMDKHLTNGKRSIPILICMDETTQKEIGVWGPRPENIARIAGIFKLKNPMISHDEFVKHLHLWYAKDKGESLQQDFLLLLPLWRKSSILIL